VVVVLVAGVPSTWIGALRAITPGRPEWSGSAVTKRSSYEPAARSGGSKRDSVPAAVPVVCHHTMTSEASFAVEPRVKTWIGAIGGGGERSAQVAVTTPPGEVSVGVATRLTGGTVPGPPSVIRMTNASPQGPPK